MSVGRQGNFSVWSRGCGGEREGRGRRWRGEVWGMRAMKSVIGVLVMAVCGVRSEEAGTAPVVMKVLVLNYDPVSEGKRLHELFGWNDPRVMAKGCIEDMEKASGGRLRLEIAEWRDLDEIYAREDGGRYTVEEYVRNRRSGKGWVEKFSELSGADGEDEESVGADVVAGGRGYAPGLHAVVFRATAEGGWGECGWAGEQLVAVPV